MQLYLCDEEGNGVHFGLLREDMMMSAEGVIAAAWQSRLVRGWQLLGSLWAADEGPGDESCTRPQERKGCVLTPAGRGLVCELTNPAQPWWRLCCCWRLMVA